MAVIPVHYFGYHPDGKFRSRRPPNGGNMDGDWKILTGQSETPEYPYTVGCVDLGLSLPKSTTVELDVVTCPQCKESAIFKRDLAAREAAKTE